MNNYKLISALAVTVSSTALFVAAANPAFAQQDIATQEAEAEEATGVDAIIVTGTRRTDRTVADSTVPVDVISGDELLNSGSTETNKLLNQLVPSFN
ncbi:MAG: TonB-dependent receptor, partial [Sphingorhabdus sp.]